MPLMEMRVGPRPIAVVRIALGLAIVSNALEVSVVLKRLVDGRIRVPVLPWLPAPTEVAVNASAAVAVLAGVALAIGYFAGTAAFVSTVLSAWFFLWDQQTYSNHRVLITLLVAYLVFARSDTAWAARRRAGPEATVPWWPQLLMMTQLSVCYFFAAASKINPDFVGGDLFVTWLRWPLPEFSYPLMAVATILTEFFLAFALWWRRTRLIAAAVGVALHVSIVAGMAEQTVPLTAFALACVPVYGLFLTRPSFSLKAAIAPSPADVVVR
jgi:hypothetical protein